MKSEGLFLHASLTKVPAAAEDPALFAGVMVSAVYARCNTVERLELWDELDSIAEHVQCPWIIG